MQGRSGGDPWRLRCGGRTRGESVVFVCGFFARWDDGGQRKGRCEELGVSMGIESSVFGFR